MDEGLISEYEELYSFPYTGILFYKPDMMCVCCCGWKGRAKNSIKGLRADGFECTIGTNACYHHCPKCLEMVEVFLHAKT